MRELGKRAMDGAWVRNTHTTYGSPTKLGNCSPIVPLPRKNRKEHGVKTGQRRKPQAARMRKQVAATPSLGSMASSRGKVGG